MAPLKRSVIGPMVLIGTLVVAEVPAQPTDADRALATELFKRGRSLMEEGRYERACPILVQSQRLDPGGGTLLNVALCHEREGKTATAWSEFHEALGIARRDDRPERMAFAEKHIAALEPKLSRLTIVVPEPSDLPSLVVRRDGTVVPRAVWGVEAPIDPGTHLVVAEADGRRRWSKTVSIGEEATVARIQIPPLEPGPPPPVAPGVPDPAPASPRPRQVESGSSAELVSGVVLGGLGLVALGVGTGAGIVAIDKRGQSDDLCVGGCTDDAVALNEGAKTAADVSTLMVVSGSVAVATAIYLIVVGVESDAEAATTAALDGTILRW